jgi:acyl carrier protein
VGVDGGFMISLLEIRRLVSEQLGLDFDEVTQDARIVEDLGAQSLDMANLVAAIEDRFGYVIQEDDIQDIVTVMDIYSLVQS